ncbi:alpha/beta hydrolase [Synechococcus sp. YX-04-1]|uniref:alpha/beta hydrolase n=1 Tax=Synechococcus sp. YX-04-1 TaxID=3062778 RepID=UPI0026E37E75|nr:alpha/beta hydrolase [Synechococcus sp. YX-04-1]MDO6352792.1 alpha/beta hydrolase [Synechococcus sp. YX-04-1]
METGSTTAEGQALLRGRLTGRSIAMGLMGSLLLSTCPSWPVGSTERVEVQIDGVVLPVSVAELGAFVRSPTADPAQLSRSELSTWMGLLAPDSRQGLIRLLKAPILSRRSLGRQLLSSWGAGPLLDALGELIRVEDGKRINRSLVLSTLEQLLERQETVSTLDVLEALPTQQLRLDLDALVAAANRWRLELERHQTLMRTLAQKEVRLQLLKGAERSVSAEAPRQSTLAVDHRSRPLQVERWIPQSPREDRTWVLMMPGLGGDPNHFHWLARSLMQAGWPVAVLEHPGSDAAAVQALLEGRQSFDGAAALRDRLADLAAVLDAQRRGDLNIPGTEVVLMGHSLGALTALLASGLEQVPGMEQRCKGALVGLPLTNLSELLQCELAAGRALEGNAMASLPRAVVGLNSFGGLIWPHRSRQALPIPLLIVGGTLDLITPPLDEQLPLLAGLAEHPYSRVVVVEGASHFSPIRVDGQGKASEGDDLFQLGEELVGVNPLSVQRVIAHEVIRFLDTLSSESPRNDAVHLIEASSKTRWHRLGRRPALQLMDQ